MKNRTEEIHLVTASGKSAFICETVDRAILRWEELGRPTDWVIQKVSVFRTDVTPVAMRPELAPKSATVTRIARDRGIAVIDVPLAISA